MKRTVIFLILIFTILLRIEAQQKTDTIKVNRSLMVCDTCLIFGHGGNGSGYTVIDFTTIYDTLSSILIVVDSGQLQGTALFIKGYEVVETNNFSQYYDGSNGYKPIWSHKKYLGIYKEELPARFFVVSSRLLKQGVVMYGSTIGL